MKRFNYKEIEKITSTPITRDLFDIETYHNIGVVYNGKGEVILDSDTLWNKIIDCCELLRKMYVETKQRKYFDELVRLLPNSYNLVNLRPTTAYVRKAVKNWSDKTHYYTNYNKELYHVQREKVKNAVERYRKTDIGKEKTREYRKKYREKNHDKIMAYQRKYRKEHLEELREKSREYQKKRREEIRRLQNESVL